MIINLNFISELLTGSGGLNVEKNISFAVKNYNSLVNNVKNCSGKIVPVKNVCGKTNKVTYLVK